MREVDMANSGASVDGLRRIAEKVPALRDELDTICYALAAPAGYTFGEGQLLYYEQRHIEFATYKLKQLIPQLQNALPGDPDVKAWADHVAGFP